MDFEKKVPEWDNVGAEPDAQLKKEGFKAGYKPPAAYFNWFFNRISEVAKELQEKVGSEIDNKPDASGGDISDTVIASAEESTAEYPMPAAGDSTKVFLGKTRKFFADIKNWMTGVCLLGQIVNNCVTDNAKLPLSAAQGKALMDAITKLNSDKASSNHNHDDRYYTENEINRKLSQNYSGSAITANTTVVKVLGENDVTICTGWITMILDITFQSSCTGVYTAYKIGTLNKSYVPLSGRLWMTSVYADDYNGVFPAWLSCDSNGNVYINIRAVSIAGKRCYIYMLGAA